MSELDLIPVHYRRSIWLRRWLRRLAAVYLIVGVSLVGARVALSHRIQLENEQIAELHVARKKAEEQRERIEALRGERRALGQRLAVLAGLRGGVGAKQMFAVVDAAMDGDVGFDNWTFRRAGELVESPSEAVETGYFIVIPREQPDEPEKAWRLETHMEISARAADHSALARFVRRLGEQPEIESVRILHTQVRSGAEDDEVDFELAVLVRSRT